MRSIGFARRVAGVVVLGAVSWSCPAWAQSSIHFGQRVQPASVPQLEPVLALSSSRPPRSLARHAEIVVVAGYQPPSHPPKQSVAVHVDRPGHRVLLILASYETVIWDVSASRNTHLTGIIVSAYHAPIVATDTTTRGYRMRLPYFYKTNSRDFVEFLHKMHAVFGIDHVDAFHGRYELPAQVRVARTEPLNPELSLSWPQPKAPPVNFRFSLPVTSGDTVMWSLTGPVDGKADARISSARVAFATDGTMYQLRGNGIRVLHSTTGVSDTHALPANYPRISWPEGVAYDRKRDLVSVVTLGGKGYLYRFDANAGKWMDYRSLNNVDLFAICYDPSADRYVAWARGGRLLFISSAGDALFSRKVADDMAGFDRLYDPGNGPAPRLKLAAHGSKVALIYADGGQVQRIWYYDVKTRQTILTFKE